MNSEIIAAVIGAVIGAGLACAFGLAQRHYEAWMSFKQDVEIIKGRFDEIQFTDLDRKKWPGIEIVIEARRNSWVDISGAVYRVRPFLIRGTSAQLTELLEKYRRAECHPDSGFLPKDLSGFYEDRPLDTMRDQIKAHAYLVRILGDIGKLKFFHMD